MRTAAALLVALLAGATLTAGGQMATSSPAGSPAPQLLPLSAASLTAPSVHADLNGDDIGDLAIGIPNADVNAAADAGAVRIFLGAASGLSRSRSQLLVQHNPEAGDHFGASLAAGLFNSDLAVGAPGDDVGTLRDAGAVSVFNASSSGALTGAGQQLLLQARPESGDLFGASLAAGDLSRDDNVWDLVVGAPGEDVSSIVDGGAINVFYGGPVDPNGMSGRSDAITAGFVQRGARFGAALAVGDLSRDDDAWDLAVGAPGDKVFDQVGAGSVEVYRGDNGGVSPLRAQFVTERHWEAGDHFGAALAIGQFNSDGAGPLDLAVGAPGEDVGTVADAGAVGVFFGASTGPGTPALSMTEHVLVQNNPERGDAFGAALGSVLFNIDAFADLAVGAPGDDVGTVADAGVVNVLLGSAPGLGAGGSRTVLQHNPERGDHFGATVIAGLFNGDETNDLAVGAPADDVGTLADAGAVSVLYFNAGVGISASSQVLTEEHPGRGNLFGAALTA
jgi:hypothetical protein